MATWAEMPRSPGHAFYDRLQDLLREAGFNLGVLMRALHGQGTPRETADALYALIFVLRTDAALAFGLIAAVDGKIAAILIVAADPTWN